MLIVYPFVYNLRTSTALELEPVIKHDVEQ